MFKLTALFCIAISLLNVAHGIPTFTEGGRTEEGRLGGERPAGGRPEGGKPEGGKPEGGKPEGGKPEGERPAGVPALGENRTADVDFEELPEEGRLGGERPAGGRLDGGRLDGGRPDEVPAFGQNRTADVDFEGLPEGGRPAGVGPKGGRQLSGEGLEDVPEELKELQAGLKGQSAAAQCYNSDEAEYVACLKVKKQKFEDAAEFCEAHADEYKNAIEVCKADQENCNYESDEIILAYACLVQASSGGRQRESRHNEVEVAVEVEN